MIFRIGHIDILIFIILVIVGRTCVLSTGRKSNYCTVGTKKNLAIFNDECVN